VSQRNFVTLSGISDPFINHAKPLFKLIFAKTKLCLIVIQNSIFSEVDKGSDVIIGQLGMDEREREREREVY